MSRAALDELESHINAILCRTMTDTERLIMYQGLAAGLKTLEDRLLTLADTQFDHFASSVGAEFKSPEDYYSGITTGLIMARTESAKLRE